MELEDLKKKIAKEAKLSLDEVEKKIEEKIDELSGLVSEEGAAYIIAKEEGLDLLEKRERNLKIKNIIPNMKAVEVIGKVISISEPREFDKGKIKGKVQSITIGDETGQIRVIFWNDKTELIKNLSVDKVIKVKKGYTKSNNFGMPEVHLGIGSLIEDSDTKINVKEKQEFNPKESFSRTIGERKKLKEIKENDLIETRAAIVSFSEKEFSTCPSCGSKLEGIGGSLVCKDHGKVEPKKNIILKGYLDDGTSALRFVSFGEVSEKIKKDNLLGKDKIFIGKIKKNEYFGDLEFTINQIKDLEVEKEIEKLK